jgi:hypothetical protein
MFQIFPHLKSSTGTKDTFRVMALWDYAAELRAEERWGELVWIQANLVELLIDSALSFHFLLTRSEVHDEAKCFVASLNLYAKDTLLHILGIVDKKTFRKLERYRELRNDLIHRLMPRVRSGSELDVLCKRLCDVGSALENSLREAHPGLRALRGDK